VPPLPSPLGAPPAELLAAARAAKGFMPDDEGLALYGAGIEATRIGAGPLLEVGTYCGKSALYLGAAARQGGGVLFSVDHHRGSEENQRGWEHHDPDLVDGRTGRMDTLPWARRAMEDAGLEDDVVLVVGRSTEVAAHWAAPLGLVFIDGGHGRDVEWADYRAWSPKVAPGGLLAIHDVFPDPADGGRPPYEIYCAALESGRFEEVDGAGCGSLRVLRRITS
jgi:predicted O-methyltransferase YrrM